MELINDRDNFAKLASFTIDPRYEMIEERTVIFIGL